MKKIVKFLLFIIFIWSVNINAQIQIGDNISFGIETSNFNFGKSVSISSDGSKVITSYIPINGIGLHEVRVFENINGDWIQFGQTIYGDISEKGFGSSIAISGDGSRIAVYAINNAVNTNYFGHVKVYEFNGTEWFQVGETISGDAYTDYSGETISMSEDGSIIALGAPSKKDEDFKAIGFVHVYQFKNNEWQQMGQNIIGGKVLSFADKLGESISISSDGYRLAVGGSGHTIYLPEINAYTISTGVVKIFDYNVATNSWEQLGSDIVGERSGDGSGSSISISNDGLTVAIGANGNDEKGYSSSGHIRVYKYDNTDWFQVGQDIDGEKSNDKVGTSVSLSGDGNQLVSETPGFVRIYRYSASDNSWGNFNVIEKSSSSTKKSISLSKDGSTIVFQNTNVAQQNKNVVQVYEANFNEISGKISIDFGNNGCVSGFIPLDNIKVTAVKGNEIISSFTEPDGTYVLFTREGNYNFIVESINKVGILDFTDAKEVVFDRFGNVETINICLASNITLENELLVDNSIASMSLNRDGSILAVGLPSFTGSGLVKVYDYAKNNFRRKGLNFMGESDDFYFGNSISLSSSGNRIVLGDHFTMQDGTIGGFKVFDYINSVWGQVGQDIEGARKNTGYSVSISDDGTRIGIGSSGGNGQVEVYEFSNGSWILIGTPIREGSHVNSHFGTRVLLSGDGNRIIITEDESTFGYIDQSVRIFEFNTTVQDWVQVGSNLGGGLIDYSSAYISISVDGNTVAIGTRMPGDDDNDYVKIFGYNGSDWVQLGNDLLNTKLVSMSDNGKRIAVRAQGINNSNNNDLNNRVARVYDYNGLNWEPFGIDIIREPHIMELSGDGNRLAIADRVLGNKVYIYDLGDNVITGVVSFDNQNNGCASLSIPARNLKINTVIEEVKATSFTNEAGFYKVPIKKDGTYNVEVSDSRFNIAPNLKEVEFVGVEGKKTANFCVSTNTVENDVSVTLLPITEARPGFNTTYQIVYENIGTVISEGELTFQFDNALQSFVNSTQLFDSQTVNSLTYNYSNLLPFESRTINITLNTEPPSTVNSNDILPLSVVIMSNETDINQSNNIFEFNQIAINSFDPNDKQVLQGSEITIGEVGDYLHYIIRFQNTGAASAINVRIRDVLENKLDWDTFLPISSSHSYYAQITEGNLVDFIFENILLPAEQDDKPNSHGFVAFKIKPKTNVQIGDTVTGRASIYFDFNLPVITNTVSTEIVDNSLSVSENKLGNYFSIYPNPTDNKIHISVKKGVNIKKIAVYSISGKLLLEGRGSTKEINLDQFSKGFYFLNIVSDRGRITKKIIKN